MSLNDWFRSEKGKKTAHNTTHNPKIYLDSLFLVSRLLMTFHMYKTKHTHKHANTMGHNRLSLALSLFPSVLLSFSVFFVRSISTHIDSMSKRQRKTTKSALPCTVYVYEPIAESERTFWRFCIHKTFGVRFSVKVTT